MKKIGMIFLIMAIVALLSVTSYAIPILNLAGDGIEDRKNGSIYAMYQNSGTLLFTDDGNNLGAGAANLANYMFTTYGVVLTPTGTTWTNELGSQTADASGTWSAVPVTTTISYYAVKAGNYFAMYQLNPAASTGSWSTFDIWSIGGPGTGGHPRNGGGSLNVSHFTGYNPGTTSVPEPSSMLLLGAGLIGLGFFSRKKK